MITAQEAQVIDTLWAGAFYEQPFTPRDVFPSRSAADRAGRRALASLTTKGILTPAPFQRGALTCATATLVRVYDAWRQAQP